MRGYDVAPGGGRDLSASWGEFLLGWQLVGRGTSSCAPIYYSIPRLVSGPPKDLLTGALKDMPEGQQHEGGNSTMPEEGDNSTKEESPESVARREAAARAMDGLSYAFVSEVYDARTFSARVNVGGVSRSELLVYRLGNVNDKENASVEKGRRALEKMLSRTIVLVRQAPEEVEGGLV